MISDYFISWLGMRYFVTGEEKYKQALEAVSLLLRMEEEEDWV
jgi:hypothetical protein